MVCKKMQESGKHKHFGSASDFPSPCGIKNRETKSHQFSLSLAPQREQIAIF